jgi:hypothetical protein
VTATTVALDDVRWSVHRYDVGGVVSGGGRRRGGLLVDVAGVASVLGKRRVPRVPRVPPVLRRRRVRPAVPPFRVEDVQRLRALMSYLWTDD